MNCAFCKHHNCYTKGQNCLGAEGEQAASLYTEEEVKLMQAAAATESRNYLKMTRLEESLFFAQQMGAKKIGIAFCIGLANEASFCAQYFKNAGLQVESACCKNCAVDKDQLNLEKIKPGKFEAMCNPKMQAELMNKAETEIVLKETIEYANKEIEKNKKKTRRIIVTVIVAFLILLIAGIVIVKLNTSVENNINSMNNTNDTNVLREYSQNADGSWVCEGRTYSFRLEISGRMHNAAVDFTFVYLSNKMDITFEQAWKAAGLSSNMNDYFDVEEAVLVEMRNE